MKKRIFAIGDLHGHYTELMSLHSQLINEAKLNPKEDVVVFLGDYVDGGPDTKKVVEQLIQWNIEYPHWHFLYGNHEDLMLDALLYGGKKYHDFDLWFRQGGRQTRDSYTKEGTQVGQAIDKDHVIWLATRPRYLETDDYIFVHAGLIPGKQPEEMEERDLLWIRDEFIDSDYDWGKKVIYGHTPTTDPNIQPNKIGIDTMPRDLGYLTAIELPTEKIWTS